MTNTQLKLDSNDSSFRLGHSVIENLNEEIEDKNVPSQVNPDVSSNDTNKTTTYSFEIENFESSNKFYFPRRFIFVIMSFFGLVMLYALRVNLSVAIVSMVQTSMKNSTKITFSGEFNWNEKTQGIVLASFFWGYVITQLPGGRLADSFGSKWILFLGVLFASVFSVISPFAARVDYKLFVACRVLEGLFEGFTFPAMHSMLAKWIPLGERSSLTAIIYSGSQVGTVLALPISAFLCDLDQGNGWPYVFYFFGLVGIIWSILWAILIYEYPEQHPKIRKSEINYIQEGQDVSMCSTKPSIPWRHVLSSIPLWALVIAHFGQNWGFYTMLTQLPRFLKNVLGFDLKKNGFYSSLPYLAQALVGCSTGVFSDQLIKNGKMKVGFVRKTANTIGFMGPAICLFLITLIDRNQVVCIILLIISMGLNGFVLAGYHVTHVDMSPNYAGTLMGITNCIANCAGFLAPYTVGVLLSKAESDADILKAWHEVFYLSSSVYLVTAIIFIVFCSNNLQYWNNLTNVDMPTKKSHQV